MIRYELKMKQEDDTMSQLEAHEKIRGPGPIHLTRGTARGRRQRWWVWLSGLGQGPGSLCPIPEGRAIGRAKAMRQLGIRVFSGQPTSKFVFQMDEEEKRPPAWPIAGVLARSGIWSFKVRPTLILDDFGCHHHGHGHEGWWPIS